MPFVQGFLRIRGAGHPDQGLPAGEPGAPDQGLPGMEYPDQGLPLNQLGVWLPSTIAYRSARRQPERRWNNLAVAGAPSCRSAGIARSVACRSPI